MDFLIHNASRKQQTRAARANKSSRGGLKQFLFKEQYRLVRGRPIRLSEAQLQENLPEIQAKVKAGLISVTLLDMSLFDIEKMEAKSVVAAKPPTFVQDSINNDKPTGVVLSQYEGAPPPETFEMPVEAPDAAFDDPPISPPIAPAAETRKVVEHDRRRDKRR